MINTIGNIWNNLIEWFKDRSDRNQLVYNFNYMAREAFVQGIAPTMLKASITKGVREYRHVFSNWMYTGFRIQALVGRALSKHEMMQIGQVVLAESLLVRRLVALGWDTLEVCDDIGVYGCRWKLIDHAHIGLMLNQNNM